MSDYHWVVLVYKVPSEPTKYRATIWREIKRLGGVYLQNGVCIFPDIDDVPLNVSALASQIRTMGGSEYMFFTESPTQNQALELVELFQAARREEYAELMPEIERLRGQAEAAASREILQALYEELKKLRKQIGVIKGRDYFSAPEGRVISAEFQQVQRTLQALQKEV